MIAAAIDALEDAGLLKNESHSEYGSAVRVVECVVGAVRDWLSKNTEAAPKIVPPKLMALEATDVPGLDPLRSIRLTVGPDQHAFVFTLPEKARLGMTQSKLENMAQVMGNLVHPAQATLIVVPDGCELGAYEVKA